MGSCRAHAGGAVSVIPAVSCGACGTGRITYKGINKIIAQGIAKQWHNSTGTPAKRIHHYIRSHGIYTASRKISQTHGVNTVYSVRCEGGISSSGSYSGATVPERPGISASGGSRRRRAQKCGIAICSKRIHKGSVALRKARFNAYC